MDLVIAIFGQPVQLRIRYLIPRGPIQSRPEKLQNYEKS